jgi:predicted ATP-dependent endonuclease of OLD family
MEVSSGVMKTDWMMTVERRLNILESVMSTRRSNPGDLSLIVGDDLKIRYTKYQLYDIRKAMIEVFGEKAEPGNGIMVSFQNIVKQGNNEFSTAAMKQQSRVVTYCADDGCDVASADIQSARNSGVKTMDPNIRTNSEKAEPMRRVTGRLNQKFTAVISRNATGEKRGSRSTKNSSSAKESGTDSPRSCNSDSVLGCAGDGESVTVPEARIQMQHGFVVTIPSFAKKP